MLAACVVHLSEVEKKGREAKTKVVQAIRDCLDEYENLFLVEYEVGTCWSVCWNVDSSQTNFIGSRPDRTCELHCSKKYAARGQTPSLFFTTVHTHTMHFTIFVFGSASATNVSLTKQIFISVGHAACWLTSSCTHTKKYHWYVRSSYRYMSFCSTPLMLSIVCVYVWRRFFMCKNSLIRVALGATPETEQRPGVHKLTKVKAGITRAICAWLPGLTFHWHLSVVLFCSCLVRAGFVLVRESCLLI